MADPIRESEGFQRLFQSIGELRGVPGSERAKRQSELAKIAADEQAGQQKVLLGEMRSNLKEIMARLNDSNDANAADSYLRSHGVETPDPWPMLEGMAKLVRRDIAATQSGTFDPESSGAIRQAFIQQTRQASVLQAAQNEFGRFRIDDPIFGGPRLEIDIAEDGEDPEWRRATETEKIRHAELKQLLGQETPRDIEIRQSLEAAAVSASQPLPSPAAQPAPPPGQAAQATTTQPKQQGQTQYSLEDLEFTAQQRGITVDEVIRQLRAGEANAR